MGVLNRVLTGRVRKRRRDPDPSSGPVERESEYARLSELSYAGEHGTGKDSQFRRQFQDSGLRRRYRVERDLSGEDYTTFRDRETGRGVVAFRGTNVKNVGDLGTDAAILFGLQGLTPRFRAAEDVTRRAIERFGGMENVDVTGHSLGGAQALHATNKTGVHAVAFNPGAGLPRSFLSKMGLGTLGAVAGLLNRGKLRSGNADIITTGIDPISFFSRTSRGTHHLRTPTGLDVHGIENFL